MTYLDRAKWLTDKFILAMLWVFPLFTGFRGYLAITEAKEGFFVVATGLWLAGIVLMLVLGLLRGERYRPQLRPAHVALAFFLMISSFSALRSPWWEVTLVGADFDGLLIPVFYGAIFFGVSALGRLRRKYIWVMAAAVTVGNVIACIQRLGLNPLGFFPGELNYYDKFQAYNSAFLGTMGNVGILGQYLCIVTPTLAVYALRSREPRERALLLGCVCLCLLTLGFSLAEGAYMGMLAAMLLGPVMLLPEKRQRKRALVLVLVLVLLGLLLAFFWPGESGTLWELSRVLHGDIRDEFGSSRVQIWRRCLELWKEHPWLGGGPGTFSLRVNIEWSRYVEAIGDYRHATVRNAHNAYLGYLTTVGLLGLGCYLALIGCSGLSWRQRRFDGPFYGALGLSLLAALVQDFFCVNLSLVTPMMWVLWGLLESPAEALTEAPDRTEEEAGPAPAAPEVFPF